MVKLQDIKDAQKAIATYAKRTPLNRSKALSDLTGANVYLKLENLQVTSSFKVRGVTNKLLHLSQNRKRRE